MTRHARLMGALALALLGGGACLPRGDAPAGRQILADRTAALISIVPANGDGMMRVLFFRPGKDSDHVDLWVLSVDPSGGPSSERNLFTDLDADFEVGYRPSAGATGLQADALGRVFLYRQVASGSPIYTAELFRVDPVTGVAEDFGQANFAIPSASGQRLVVYSSSGGSVIIEADGSMTVVDSMSVNFVGDTAFYVTSAGALMRFPLGGAPVQVATSVSDAFPLNAHTLLVRGVVPGSDMPGPLPDQQLVGGSATLLDTTTLAQTPLPDGFLYQSSVQFSSDLRWLVVGQPSQDPNAGGADDVLVDTVTGTVETLSPVFGFAGGWRPGHDELWASPYDPDQTGLLSSTSLSIKRPGQPIVVLPGVYFNRFNDDGTYWFSRGAEFNASESSDLVGIADDPTGPRFPVVPNGSSLGNQWTLGDGRLLVDSTIGLDSFEDSYVQVVDPRNGATQVLGEHGYLAAVGQTRALGLYHVGFLRGDLTTTDFTTGQATVLAPEFAMSAVAEPQGADAFPPGGRIVYQFRARFESPWDGLWLATVP